MSKIKEMIELSVPSVMREHRPERMTVTGFTCPDCNGNGWGWRQDYDDPEARQDGWLKKTCPTCGGTGEVDAEVTVNWIKQKGGTA